MSKPLTYTVIVPTFNRSDMLGDSLRSIAAQDWPLDDMEIVVVDNASTDDTSEVIKTVQAELPRVPIRSLLEKRPGLSFARNTGVLAARGSLLVLTDDDVFWDSGVLSNLKPAFDESDVVGATGCTVPDFEGSVPSWLRWLWLKQPFGRCCGTYSLLEGPQNADIAPDWVFGVHLALRRDAVLSVDGFPSDSAPAAFQRWQGDGETGLCFRLAEKGGRFRFMAKSRITHRISASRLSLEFVQRRMFFQGIVNSYHLFRCPVISDESNPSVPVSTGTGLGNTFQSLFYLMRNDRGRLIEIIEYRIARLRASGRKVCRNLSPRQKFLRQLSRWEQEGFCYHQEEVKKDSELLEWVLRESYFDADYPEDAYALRNDARSY